METSIHTGAQARAADRASWAGATGVALAGAAATGLAGFLFPPAWLGTLFFTGGVLRGQWELDRHDRETRRIEHQAEANAKAMERRASS